MSGPQSQVGRPFSSLTGLNHNAYRDPARSTLRTGEVEGGRGTPRVQLTEAAHGLAGRHHLHPHAPILELPDHLGIGPQAAIGAGPHHQVRRKLLQDLNKVVHDQPMAVLAPPVPHHRSGRTMRSLVASRPSTMIRPNA